MVKDCNEKNTSLACSVATKKRLAEFGKYGDSMDKILNMLLDSYDAQALEEE